MKGSELIPRKPDPQIRRQRFVAETLFALHILLAIETPSLAQKGVVINVSSPSQVMATGLSVPVVEPHLAVNPTDPNNLVVASAAFPTPGESHELRVFASFDMGDTWSDQAVESSVGEGIDAWLAADNLGTFYLATLSPMRVRRSSDKGRSWSEPVSLPLGGARSFDYPKLAVDHSTGQFGGSIYVFSSQAVRRGVSPVSVHRSSNQGIVFSEPSSIRINNFNNQVGDAVVLSDGVLLGLFHEISVHGEFLESPRLWAVLSDNGGSSFSPPYLVAEEFKSESPFLAVDRSGLEFDGRIYAAWMGHNGDFGIFVSFSDDGGKRWSSPRRANDFEMSTPSHSPMIAVSSTGIVALTWQAPEPEPSLSCYAMQFTASLDGGVTFLPMKRVSSDPSCPDSPANRVTFGVRDITIAQRFSQGGDYHGLAALPDGGFRAVWAESHNGPFELLTSYIEVRRNEGDN